MNPKISDRSKNRIKIMLKKALKNKTKNKVIRFLLIASETLLYFDAVEEDVGLNASVCLKINFHSYF